MDLNSCDSSYDPDPVFTPGIGTPLDHIHRLAETLSDPDMPYGIKFFTLNATLAALLVTRQGDLCKEEFEAYCDDIEACYFEEIQARYPAVEVPQRSLVRGPDGTLRAVLLDGNPWCRRD